MRKEIVLPVAATACGVVGCFLRRWELASVFEPDTGLPVPGMPATVALIALCVAAAVLLALLCRGTGRDFTGGYDEAFRAPGNAPYMTAMVAAAFLMAISGGLLLLQAPELYREASELYQEASTQSRGTPMLGMLPKVLLAVLILASAWSLLQLGRNNFKGEGKGKYSSSLLIPAYAACMWLIVAYQARSGDPVILDYVYQLFAIIATVLGSYFMAGFGFARPKVFPAAFFSLAAMVFILITLADAHEPAFLLLCGGYFLYFAASAAALLSNAAKLPETPGGERLSANDQTDREGTPDEG